MSGDFAHGCSMQKHKLRMQVNLSLESKAKHARKRSRPDGQRNGSSFSADNPYGKREM